MTTYGFGACAGHDAVLAVADDEAGGRAAAAEEGARRARLPLPRPPRQRHVQKRVLHIRRQALEHPLAVHEKALAAGGVPLLAD